ncbi:MAG: radical SAM protein, partial [Vicinamibacterales bacterium]|nr:radical SAM protein [Vicinamibacterales bacterium]
MQIPIEDRTILRAPAYSVRHVSGAAVALDPGRPHWIGTDERGLRLLGRFDGRTPFVQVVRDYATESGLDVTRAWLHVETFAHDGLRQGFLSTDGAAPAPYLGRSAYLDTERLQELWIQVNDFCNLSCAHCLVSSGPDREQGLPTERIKGAIDQAVALGAERLFFTGGEPLARPDILELVEWVVTTHQRELVILTNGTLFKGDRLERLAALAAEANAPRAAGESGGRLGVSDLGRGLRIQVSLDGPTAEINDPIRGAGTFERILEGVDTAVAAGLRPTLTATILRHNLEALDGIVRLASEHGVRNVHLLWPHRRGRVLEGALADLPSAEEILVAVRKARATATELGVSI